jgi:hypothetical protein
VVGTGLTLLDREIVRSQTVPNANVHVASGSNKLSALNSVGTTVAAPQPLSKPPNRQAPHLPRLSPLSVPRPLRPASTRRWIRRSANSCLIR